MINEKILDKASKIIAEAMERYRNGDYDKGNELRENYNNLMSTLTEEKHSKDNILYGENRNFGVIFDVHCANVCEAIRNKGEYKKSVNEFRKLIQANPVIKEQHNVYDSLCENKGITSELADSYINEIYNVMPCYDKKTLKENNQSLIECIRKYDANELVNVDENTQTLYEAVETLLTTDRKNLSNAAKICEAKNVIKEHLLSNGAKEEKKNDVDEMYEKWGEKLNEAEMDLIREYVESEDKEALFNSYKDKTLKKLREIANAEDGEKIREAIKMMEEKQYNKKTAITEIASMAEIVGLND
ncbi:MAG: hypothetical protein LUD72_03320 [Bacteroidales bacterium]|nr:hypothetical protein [Bacteroidales bacterium]